MAIWQVTFFFIFLRQRRKQNELLEEILGRLMWAFLLTCDLYQASVLWRKPAGEVPQGLDCNWWIPVEFPTTVNIHIVPWTCPSCIAFFSSYCLSKFGLVRSFGRWCRSDTSGCPLKLVGPPVSTLLTLLHVLPFVAAPLSVPWPLPALLSVPFPHLFTELVHRVQVRVVNELHEVSVPDLLAGRQAAWHFFGLWALTVVIFMKKFFQMVRVNDFQGHLQQSLHESVLHSMTQVVARVLLLQTAKQEPLFSPDDVVTHSDLLLPIVISPLKLPVYQGSLWLRTAFQERAAILYSIDDSLLKAVPMVIIMVL